MRPSQTLRVLEDLCNKYMGPLYRKGVELSSNDSSTVTEVYQQWLLLMIDLGYLHHDTLKRDAHRLLSDMMTKDVLSLNNAFAELLALVRTQETRGFKALCGEISSHLYNLIKSDIVLISKGDVYAARRLVQLFSYTSRLSLVDIDLTQQCLDDYMATEESMDSWYPSFITSSLNKIIKRWMKSFSPDNFRFQHGPGGVAGHGRTSLEVKYKDLTSDALIDYAFGDAVGVISPIPSTCDRISQTIFVPKSYKTFRTISMESSTTQYLQQGVWREIDRVVSNSRFLRARIGFHEQERNQLLAKEGSFNRNYATIDLSAASDSVSYELVKRVFRGTQLLRYLVATRSRRTLLPDGRLIELKKFAPMGSALCFPVETIIFAAICHFVTREYGVTGDYSVFGDDIIVPTQCAEDVMCVLGSLGFRVNRDKSFYRPEHWFRESCGAEYCDGFDVTPMRISRKYNHSERLERLAGLVDLANAAYAKSFKNLRCFFITKLRNEGYIAHFSPTSLHADNYTNYHTKRRWSFNLQRIECEVTTLVCSPSIDRKKLREFEDLGFDIELSESMTSPACDESIRLRHWFESTLGRTSIQDGFQSSITKASVCIRNRWRQKFYEDQDQSFIDYFTVEEKI